MYNQLLNYFFNILTLGYIKHLEFHKILINIYKKLPREQKQAKPISKDLLQSIGIDGDSSLLKVHSLNKSNHQTSITEMDLDTFYQDLELFKPFFFKKYYKNRIDEFKALNPNAINKDSHLIFFQNLLSNILNNPNQYPTKPKDILLYHLKYKWAWSSKIYTILNSKLNKRNKLIQP